MIEAQPVNHYSGWYPGYIDKNPCKDIGVPSEKVHKGPRGPVPLPCLTEPVAATSRLGSLGLQWFGSKRQERPRKDNTSAPSLGRTMFLQFHMVLGTSLSSNWIFGFIFDGLKDLPRAPQELSEVSVADQVLDFPLQGLAVLGGMPQSPNVRKSIIQGSQGQGPDLLSDTRLGSQLLTRFPRVAAISVTLLPDGRSFRLSFCTFKTLRLVILFSRNVCSSDGLNFLKGLGVPGCQVLEKLPNRQRGNEGAQLHLVGELGDSASLSNEAVEELL
ncbi:hypothetical protein Nepgr_015713 [Nepenthes gracilis]|uniref:Uncharacterized protein n=1 Tax=Nepenthes gracilis TaxID=150966 RepID=A0AAD3XQM0_NEPGR|nr:hypothetical protein Nepgr_015713 [Nepenthes gracilis]